MKMKRISLKRSVVFLAVFFILLAVGLETASAQEFLTFTGKVVAVGWRSLGVQGSQGHVMYFAVGRKTVYVPSRSPLVGERVRIKYLIDRGRNIGYQVNII